MKREENGKFPISAVNISYILVRKLIKDVSKCVHCTLTMNNQISITQLYKDLETTKFEPFDGSKN